MSGGWTVVDSATNKSLPIQGTSNSGARVPYFAPAPGNQDPVGKMRISSPQALIDTDFEYGTQPTKWESIALQNNRQSVYYIAQQPIPGITSIAGDGSTATLTILTSNTTGAAAGVPIFIQNSNSTSANGWWTITSFSAGVSITVQIAAGTSVPVANQYNAALTYAYIGYFYSGCGIQVATGSGAAFTASTTTVTGTTVNPHGLSAGSFIYVQGTTAASSNPPNGAWVVATVPTANTFTFTVNTAPVGAITATAGANVSLYARPSGFVEPRSFDGGVAFSAGGAIPDQQLIRQTRRYFRYQSGKGIQFSTGSSLKPALFVTSITGSGSTATVTSRYQHNLTAGAKIQVFGCNEGVYNGTFTVLSSGLTATQFQYTTNSAVGAVTTATGAAIRVSPLSWYGSANRVGLFDQQNGMFFEYDGQQLFAVLRNSINQAAGTVAVTQGSSVVTGTGTQFSTQCLPGQYVVIRGQSYRVVAVTSDTSMYVSPEYRGATISGALLSVTLETRIPQSSWSDPCNGTGPSGYNLDLTRMQMWYIDYSWYGAGVIRYGFRATNGQINYVTQIQNNNVQFEAYMRSGNMAAHYESNGLAPTTYLTSSLSNNTTTTTAALGTTDVTISVASTSPLAALGVVKIDSELIYYVGISGTNLIGCIRGFGGTTAAAHANGATVSPSSIDLVDVSRFPTAGTIKVQGAGQTGTIEYIAYTGNDGSILYGLTRGQTGGSASTTFTYSATAPVSASLSSPDTVPSLSHWGSSVIMDGRFDDDKSLIFNYGTVTAVSTSSTSPVVLLAIRIAPSVDNGQTGLLGVREIINRMQLQLDSLGVVTTGNTYLINLVLNGYATGALSSGFVSPIQQANGITSSLAQIAVNTNAVSVFGGESVAAAYCAAGTVSNLDLSQVRDLGNSILGGGTSNTVPTTASGFYPDGPDILYVVAQAVSATAGTILARLSWKEAQA
jgi:hypothetical protein